MFIHPVEVSCIFWNIYIKMLFKIVYGHDKFICSWMLSQLDSNLKIAAPWKPFLHQKVTVPLTENLV